jgi:hypothetical protein
MVVSSTHGRAVSTDGRETVAYSYGSISGTVPAGANVTVYGPAGRNVSLTAQPNTVEITFGGWSGMQFQPASALKLQTAVSTYAPAGVHASFVIDYTDIRTFAIAGIGVFVAAAYVFVVRRGFAPRVKQ